jgi:hypothetical protein
VPPDYNKDHSSYFVIRTPGEGLGFTSRDEAVAYATRKHEQTGDWFTVARSLLDIFSHPEDGTPFYFPHRPKLAHYLVMATGEASISFESRSAAEEEARMKCKRTGIQYEILYLSENLHPNVIHVATVTLQDGKPVTKSYYT